ncbi:MAG: hypothetical protein IIA88_05075 [Bacteroidetes bacterium]|nr:hypothetical protein [Bacteroidota bacterium]
MKTSLKNTGLIIILFCFCFTPDMSGQSKYKHTKKDAATYVKIEIAGHGLHCPFLGDGLKDKLKSMDGFNDLYIDKQDQYLIFNFPAEMNLTQEELFNIPLKVGYPAELINVIIAGKPFKIKEVKINQKNTQRKRKEKVKKTQKEIDI